MTDDIQPEMTEEAFFSREKEIATLFAGSLEAGAADPRDSEARIQRILERTRKDSPSPEGEARIDRILQRIQKQVASGVGE